MNKKAIVQRGRQKPSGAKVASVLAIRRYQGTRLWKGEAKNGRKGIEKKIGKDELEQLIGMLKLAPEELPRLWRAKRQPALNHRSEESGLEADESDADYIHTLTQQTL